MSVVHLLFCYHSIAMVSLLWLLLHVIGHVIVQMGRIVDLLYHLVFISTIAIIIVFIVTILH